MSIAVALPLNRPTPAPALRGSPGHPGAARNASHHHPARPRRADAVQLLTRMSHELKTPLGAVLGFAHLMASDPQHPLSEAQRRRIELIEQAGRHMLTIIAGLLQAPADPMQAGKVDAHEEVDIGAVIEESLQWMQPTAQRYGVELSAEMVGGRVRGSAQGIRQVFLNLLSNAAKYNHRGGHVRVRQLDPGNAYIGIEVSDDGRGMNAEMLGRLFTPFDRLGAEESEVDGTGVGLCIVRDLVERMGGYMEVRSEWGRGSQFSVWLKRT